MTEKEKMFCEFMYETDLSKTKDNIYKKIINTPDNLLEGIEEKFAEECKIFKRYSYEPNYWDTLKEEYEKNRMILG
ncbi:MAG: hypothetical protein HQL08_03360 [Nitrospirae bacterium]|nr:hypothetical protein [Nitrospirota bacterium]